MNADNLKPRSMITRAGAVLLVLLLGACASTRNDEALVQAREQVQAASTNPHVARFAPVELSRAQEALRSAEAATREERGRDEVAHRAYVATQLARTAAAQAEARMAQERLQQASAERDRIKLQARSREAELAQQQAAEAQRMAQLAQEQQQQMLAQQRQQQAQRELAEAQQRAQMEAQRAEQLQQQLKEFEAKQTQRGTVMTLGGDVLFDTGKSNLRAGARRTIDRLADVLQQHPERRVSVEGFTDAQGPEDYNMELARQRAEAVKQALVQEGVPEQQIETKAYGEAYPVANNDTPAGRQMNRRVEIVISNEQGQIGERQ